jgi:predicted N-acetyltransferase YhbS
MSDIPAIMSIIREVHPECFAERLAEQTREELREGHCVPELALSAVADGSVVGHVHFVGQDVLCEGEVLRGLELQIASVREALQRQGIGTALIAQAHRMATSLGYAVSVVLGWQSYYPRFGYRPIFGEPHVQVATRECIHDRLWLKKRNMLPEDLPRLRDIWFDGNRSIAFAIAPNAAFSLWPKDPLWVFHEPNDASAVRGLVMFKKSTRELRAFEAVDRETALQMLGHLVVSGFADENRRVDLPLHSDHRLCGELTEIVEKRSVVHADALMACDLSSKVVELVYQKSQTDRQHLATYWTPRGSVD